MNLGDGDFCGYLMPWLLDSNEKAWIYFVHVLICAQCIHFIVYNEHYHCLQRSFEVNRGRSLKNLKSKPITLKTVCLSTDCTVCIVQVTLMFCRGQ